MPRRRNTDPEIVELPDVTVAFVHSSGDPTDLGPRVMKSLYTTAYTLKKALKEQGVDMPVGMPRTRWNWTPGQATPGEMEGDWAVVVPDDTREIDLVQNDPEVPMRIARWQYGTCARILHLGAYDAEEPTIARLVAFIDERGYEIVGLHEEWYLSGPDVLVPKTAILYPVRTWKEKDSK